MARRVNTDKYEEPIVREYPHGTITILRPILTDEERKRRQQSPLLLAAAEAVLRAAEAGKNKKAEG